MQIIKKMGLNYFKFRPGRPNYKLIWIFLTILSKLFTFKRNSFLRVKAKTKHEQTPLLYFENIKHLRILMFLYIVLYNYIKNYFYGRIFFD
jgi:hypothetical protein